MAFFKFRFPGRDRAPAAPAAQAPAESVEGLRRRARHRLIGAAVLVLIGVVGFPLLFDTQPRPVAVDIPIEIPDRTQAAPLAQPAPAAAASIPAAAPAPVAEAPAPEPTPAPSPAPVAEAPATAPAAAPAPSPAPVAAAPAAAPRADDSARARALLEGKQTPPHATPAAADSGRFVVQVGAFSDDAKAREARQKVERAGLKTYTQVVDTKDGKRTRVRVGPFASRADADKAASRIKGLDLPAAILTL
ncbi:MAG: SPOR domain-containing protein [Burkholderiales bacterium]|jgi:DedD protein|nr:SPOR domain-containing protein [Burkholderiales bacterium]